MLVVVEFLLEYSAFSATISTCFVLWFLAYLTRGVCKSKANLEGKTVIITGASSGIGKATALDLAKRGARIIMACRNVEKANAVRDKIIEHSKNKNVVVKKIDLSILASVRKFAEELNEEETRLDVLIHNAGIAFLQTTFVIGESSIPYTTEEGLNSVWATNHLGAFLLTHLLIDLLKKTGKSRIIIVSSDLHWFGTADPKVVNSADISQSKWRLYCDTKLANVLFANELSRRLKDTDVTANSLHPGLIFTDIWRSSTILKPILWVLSCFIKDEEEGAQTTIHLAVSEKVDALTGKYFVDCREWLSNPKAKDVFLGNTYWIASENCVDLKSSDPKI